MCGGLSCTSPRCSCIKLVQKVCTVYKKQYILIDVFTSLVEFNTQYKFASIVGYPALPTTFPFPNLGEKSYTKTYKNLYVVLNIENVDQIFLILKKLQVAFTLMP